jgi:hypothetical protein
LTEKKSKKSIYRRVKTPKGIQFGVGDLVEYWWYRNVKRDDYYHEEKTKFKGIIKTLGGNGPCIRGHAEIYNGIVPYKNIIGVIKKRAINPKMIKYL